MVLRLLLRAVFVLQHQGKPHRPISRGEGNHECGENDDDQFPPNRGEQLKIIENQDCPGHEENAHVIDEVLANLMNAIELNPSHEKEDEKQNHAD